MCPMPSLPRAVRLLWTLPRGVIVERLHDTPPRCRGVSKNLSSVDGVTAVVDYAHTDDAMRKALTVLRGITKGRLIAVLGCQVEIAMQ